MDVIKDHFFALKQQLPRIASLLDTDTDHIKIFENQWYTQDYMKSEYRDPIIKSIGVYEGMPIIQKRRMQGKYRVGYGMFLHRNYLDHNLKFVTYITQDNEGMDQHYVICKVGDVFKLKRNAARLNRMCNEVKDAPILSEGILDEIVQNTVGFLLQSRHIEKYGVKIKRGLILDGPPGNGKTMACRYIQKLCTQHDISWGTLTSADIDQAYSEKSLDSLFQEYTVTFFDDIDISYLARDKGNGKMACSLLTAMDGLADDGHLIRIFTTNEPLDTLDKAFIRPGRIDKCITFNPPSEDLRKKLIATWPEEIRNNIDMEEILERSHDFSFAELEAIRTFLVTNKILGSEKWNLDRAFEEFFQRRPEKKRKGMGF